VRPWCAVGVPGTVVGMGPEEMARLWDEHTAEEFALRDVDATMATMVPEPSVVHLPTLIGAQGQEGVRRFYAEEFIGEGAA
jgi:carboxymethylenebutenolidase